MDQEAHARHHFERMSPDVRALMESASAKSAAERTMRRSAARARADSARHNKMARTEAYDKAVFAALVAFIVICWMAAGFALYFI